MLGHFGDSNNNRTITKNNSLDTNLLTATDVVTSNEYTTLVEEKRTNTTNIPENTKFNLESASLETKIWVENCTSPLDNIRLNDSRVLSGLLPLGIICLVVIIGNVMVMSAVKMTHKLRGATYLFIVSLGKKTLI